MKKMTLILAILIGLTSLTFAQAPDTLWTKGYRELLDQSGSDVCEVKGGYVIAGARFSQQSGNYDASLVKIDGLGSMLWNRSYGDENYDVANSIRVTRDNKLIVAGSRMGGSNQVILFKTEANGALLWLRTYTPANGGSGFCIRQANDGGYIIAGQAIRNGSDALILKTDSVGTMEWYRVFGRPVAEDQAFGVCAVREGGYALVGYEEIQPGGHLPAVLIRIAENGDSLWSRGYERGACDFRAIEQTTDDGFIMAGRTWIYNGNWWDVYLVKTNSSGDTLWTRAFGGSQWDGAFSVQQTYDGGYFVGAYSMSFGNNVCFYFIKTDSLGNLLWERAVGTDHYNWGAGAIQCHDGGYLMVGTQDVSEGNGMDICAVKLLPDVYMDINDNLTQPVTMLLDQNYPNPFNATTKISYVLPQTGNVKLSIYNLLGQHVATLFDGIQPAGVYSYNWDASGCPSGLYFARLSTVNEVQNIKMMLMK